MKKLFTNDKFFLAMVLSAVICGTANALISIFAFNYAIQAQLTLLFRIACVVIIYLSYKKHSKNVMKGMIGALLASQFITALQYTSNMKSVVETIDYSLFIVLSLFLFINHFVINSEHHSNPIQVLTNQILVVMLFLNNTICDVILALLHPSTLAFVWGIVDIVGFLGLISVVVCIESRLDAYRLDREAAGWTEEKGYPEGYVHEFEKKENK